MIIKSYKVKDFAGLLTTPEAISLVLESQPQRILEMFARNQDLEEELLTSRL